MIPRWRAARADQETAKAETTAQKRDAKTARAALTVQLKRNILTVALEVAGAPETEWREALRLFPQHLLEPAGRRGPRRENLEANPGGPEAVEDSSTPANSVEAEDEELLSN